MPHTKSMSEPDGSTSLSDSIDSSAAPPLEPGSSASGVHDTSEEYRQEGLVAPPERPPKKAIFGVLKQDTNNHYEQPQNVVFSDDYEKRLPEDPYCKETAPNARIWRTYVEEAAAFDAVYVGQARDGLDVMLVFAGLFSAVVTSFLVQVSQSLQADYTAMSAILLHDLVSVQLSISGSRASFQNITVPSVNPLQIFQPDSITVWVNGLWAVSLTASLVVALSAVLVKQWLHHYTSIPSGTPGARSHLRQYRFDGLQKWRVNVIIGLFPIIMHTSLVLFLMGLVLFFVPLRTSLACAVGVITVVHCLLYLVSSAIPVFFPQCPYKTPLTDFIYHTCVVISKASQSTLIHVRRLAYEAVRINTGWILHYLHFDTKHIRLYLDRPHCGIPLSETLKQVETEAVELCHDTISVDALGWLFKVSSNPTVHSLVIQSIGGLPPSAQAYADSTWTHRSDIRDVRDRLLTQFDAFGGPRCVVGSKNVYERLNRSFCFLSYRKEQATVIFKGIPDGPRSTAASLVALGSIKLGLWLPDWYEDELRKSLCTFHNVELHPLVWMKLVQAVTAQLLQGKGHEFLPTQDYAHVISLFLPVCAYYERYKPVSRSAVTLRDVVISDNISDHIEDCLLKMLSSTLDDNLPLALPTRYRILYEAGIYAALNVADELGASPTDVESCRHSQLLLDVLKILSVEYNIILKWYPCFLAPLCNLLRVIVDDTPICEYSTAGSREHPELHEMLKASHTAILLLTHWIVIFCPDFVFPSFHRLLEVSAHHLTSKWQRSQSFVHTFHLLYRGLNVGNEAMYRAFIDGGWIWMLAEGYITDGQEVVYTRLCCDFVQGLNSMSSALTREFFDYCQQQARNFLVMFFMVTANLRGPDGKFLLALCPRNSSEWVTHHTTLEGIMDWCQAPNRDDLPFPLDNLFNGKVVQSPDGREVSLDEALRMNITRDCTVFEWAARTILLGEAAPDPPDFPE